jgi:hypothetical protein
MGLSLKTLLLSATATLMYASLTDAHVHISPAYSEVRENFYLKLFMTRFNTLVYLFSKIARIILQWRLFSSSWM